MTDRDIVRGALRELPAAAVCFVGLLAFLVLLFVVAG